MRLVDSPLSCLDYALSKLKDRESVLLSVGIWEGVLCPQAGRVSHWNCRRAPGGADCFCVPSQCCM